MERPGVSTRMKDASRVSSWCEYEDFEGLVCWCCVFVVCLVCRPGVSMKILKVLLRVSRVM
jgi:hypothetical protein